MNTSRLEATAVNVGGRLEAVKRPRARSIPNVLDRIVVGIPAYPTLFAANFLLLKVGESWSPLQVVVRPMVVVVVALAVLQLVIGAAAGRHVAGYFVSVILLVLIEPAAAALVIVAGVAPVAWRWASTRHFSAVAWAELTGPLNLIAAVALGVTVAMGISSGWYYLDLPATSLAAVGTAPADAPDIYLILLDGYPRSDLLQHEIGLDNGPFLASMEQLGFEVSDASHSNYGRTALTLASMFNAQHADDLIPNPPGDAPAQARELGRLINRGTQLDLARSRGYEIVSIPSPVDYVTLFAADRVLQSPFATEFELTLTEQDAARRIATDARHWLFIDQHRRRIMETFQTLAELPAETSSRPRLVFAHVLSPHPPIAFGAAGEEVMLAGCEWTLCGMPLPLPEAFRSDYAAQVTYLDTLVESTARTMLADSTRPSVIIFFSDHGSRLSGTADSTFDNLVLSYTPGKPGLFPRDATPINLLPRILNAYVGTNEPLAPEVQYQHPFGAFFPLEPVQP